jgi:hypothetical protein
LFAKIRGLLQKFDRGFPALSKWESSEKFFTPDIKQK